MKNFDFKRFGQVLKNDLCEARLHYITWGCALLATLIVAYTLLIIKHNYLYTDGDVTRLLAPVWLNTIDKITRVIGTVLLVGCALWVPTSMTANFATRGRCIAALSLPASTGEKFASRLVVFWLVPVLFSLLMFWLMPLSYENIPGETFSRWRAYRLPINLTLGASGLVVLAGTLAQKRVMLKLILTLTGVVMVILLMAFLLDNQANHVVHPHELNWIDRLFNYINAEQYRISIAQLAVSETVVTVCLLVSYFRYKRFTLKR
ncbi:MAG: hypothetical protein IKP62_02140 [Salinivirgaceae bacterium]|nr:hypothetical protein [Salinivirgaceae bacterium]